MADNPTLDPQTKAQLDEEVAEAVAAYEKAKGGLAASSGACHFEGCTCNGYSPAILPPHNCRRRGCGHGAVYHYG